MKLLAQHLVLTQGNNRSECESQVLAFFDKTSLVRYDKISINAEKVISGDHQDFTDTLDRGLEKNRKVLENLLKELRAAGFEGCQDILTLPQGYPSKVLHIIAHFLDGFVGIDTAFYNLIDDSHWVPEDTAKRIAEEPQQYWLFALDCYSMTPREAALLHM